MKFRLPGQRDLDEETAEIKKILTGNRMLDPEGNYVARSQRFYYNFAGIPTGFENANLWGIDKREYIYYGTDSSGDSFEEVVKVMKRMGHPVRLFTAPKAMCIYHGGGITNPAIMKLENSGNIYRLQIFMPKGAGSAFQINQLAKSFQTKIKNFLVSDKDLPDDYTNDDEDFE